MAIVLTTTSINIDPELENRCLVVSVDENREQTLAIQARQREAQTFEEFVRAETAIRVCARQCNAQRLLIQLHDYVRLRSQELSVEGLENVRFTRREIRERLKLGQTRLAAHLSRLVQYEYVQTYPINGRKLHCGLNWDGRGRKGELILGGLVDPKAMSEPAPITTLLSAQEPQ